MKTSLLIMLIVAMPCLPSGAQSPDEKKPVSEAQAVEPKNVTPEELENLVKENPKIVILDIRMPAEYETGHISGAININALDRKFEEHIGKLDRNTPVLIYGGTSGRSTQALPKFAQLKFLRIYHLNSGLRGWMDAGKPTVTGEKK